MWGIPQRLHCFQEILMLLIQIDDMWLKFKPSQCFDHVKFLCLGYAQLRVLYPSNSNFAY